MVLLAMNIWDPNAELGDLKLMALAPWINHEKSRVVEMKEYWPGSKMDLFSSELKNQIPWP